MSRFDQARFGLSSFNIDAGGVRWLRAGASASVLATVSADENDFLRSWLLGSVAGEAEAEAGRFLPSAEFSVAFTSSTVTGEAKYFAAEVSAWFAGTGEIPFTGWLSHEAEAELSAAGDVGGKAWLPPGAGSAVLDAEARLGQKVFFSGTERFANFDASAGAEATNEFFCELDVTIPPGGVLTVDAGDFNVFLGNVNVVHTQSGAWLSELNRATRSIQISADQRDSEFSATVFYTERFL